MVTGKWIWQVCVHVLNVKEHNLPFDQDHVPVILCACSCRPVQVVDDGPLPLCNVGAFLSQGQCLNLLGDAYTKYMRSSLVYNPNFYQEYIMKYYWLIRNGVTFLDLMFYFTNYSTKALSNSKNNTFCNMPDVKTMVDSKPLLSDPLCNLAISVCDEGPHFQANSVQVLLDPLQSF